MGNDIDDAYSKKVKALVQQVREVITDMDVSSSRCMAAAEEIQSQCDMQIDCYRGEGVESSDESFSI